MLPILPDARNATIDHVRSKRRRGEYLAIAVLTGTISSLR